jgi:hypothetical protein
MSENLYFQAKLEEERKKAFAPMGFKNQRRNLRQLPQTAKGQVNKDIDSRRHALLPGKRISKNGNTYWETRASRSDQKGSSI